MEVIIIDWLSVLIAAILYMIFGALWYSPYFFGKAWMKFMNLTPQAMKGKSWRYIVEFIAALVMALFLATVQAFLQANTTWDGIFVGIGIWIGFIAPVLLSTFLWAEKTWKLFWIDASFFLLAFILMGGIIGA